MTFSSKVKEELCKVPPPSRECAGIELSAMLLFGRCYPQKSYYLQTDQIGIAKRMVKLFEDMKLPAQFEPYNDNLRHKTKFTYTLTPSDTLSQTAVSQFLEQQNLLVLPMEGDREKVAALLRGCYLVCGSMNDPAKEYHAEFAVQDHDLAGNLAQWASSIDLPAKVVKRANYYILYFKESESIEDLLTLIGATKSSLKIMGIKVLKEIRNNANRATNCETANVDKIVKASMRQMEDIKRLDRVIGLQNLPSQLVETSLMRLQYPELTLEELAEMMPTKVSRSGIHHRFRRLHELAENCKIKEINSD